MNISSQNGESKKSAEEEVEGGPEREKEQAQHVREKRIFRKDRQSIRRQVPPKRLAKIKKSK